MLGLEPVEPVPAELRDDPSPHLRLIGAVQGAWQTVRGVIVVSHVWSQSATVSGVPALPALPASRLLSSSRTLRVTSASVKPIWCLRSGDPSSLMPSVTQPCHHPS